MTLKETLEIMIDVAVALKNVLLGGAGGIVAYMYDYSRTKKMNKEIEWSNSAVIINMFIGAFVASSLATFIPAYVTGRDGLVAFIGVSSYAILGIVESRFAKYILGKTVGFKDGL